MLSGLSVAALWLISQIFSLVFHPCLTHMNGILGNNETRNSADTRRKGKKKAKYALSICFWFTNITFSI